MVTDQECSTVNDDTHYKEHECTGAPCQSNKVAVAAKQESTQHGEDHPKPERGKGIKFLFTYLSHT